MSTIVSIPINSPNVPKRRSSVTILPNYMPPVAYFDQANLKRLEGMGFSELRAMQALLIHEGKFELALDWLLELEHPEESAALLKLDQDALDDALAKYKLLHP